MLLPSPPSLHNGTAPRVRRALPAFVRGGRLSPWLLHYRTFAVGEAAFVFAVFAFGPPVRVLMAWSAGTRDGLRLYRPFRKLKVKLRT